MPIQTQEARIILAIEAIRTTKRLNSTTAAKLYNVLHSTLRDRINGRTTLSDCRPPTQKLTELEESVLLQYILDPDSRGFAPRLASVEDIVNYILESRGEKRVEKL
jgi:hypothetical protein